MKYFLIILLTSSALWCEIKTSFLSSLEIKSLQDNQEIQSTFDMRLSQKTGQEWSLSLLVIALPQEDGVNESLPEINWGGSLETGYMKVGRITLQGLYNTIESKSFPSLASWGEQASSCLEKSSPWNDRFGISIFTEERDVLFHYLYCDDQEQVGLLWQPMKKDETHLYRGEIGLFMSDNQQTISDDESWYNPNESPVTGEIFHLLVGTSFHFFPESYFVQERGVSCHLSSSLSQDYFPGWELFLSYEEERENLRTLVVWGQVVGDWRNGRAEKTSWYQGLGVEFSFFENHPVSLLSRGNICLPTNDESLEAESQWTRGPHDYREEITLKIPFFSLLVGGDYRTDYEGHRLWLAPEVYCDWNGVKVKLKDKFLRDQEWNQKISFSLSQSLSNLLFEVWTQIEPEEKVGQWGSSLEFKSESSWFIELSYQCPVANFTPEVEKIELTCLFGW